MPSSPPHRPSRRRARAVGIAAAVAGLAVLVIAAVTKPAPDGAAGTTPVPSATPAGTRPAASPSAAATTPSGRQTGRIDTARRIAGDPRALGRLDAPVVLVEYADFRCPFCGIFARQTKPALMRYVRDGTLRIEFRDMPIFGIQSEYAAEASHAAAAQGRFWQFYDAVYADAPRRGHPDLTTTQLERIGHQAGVPDLADYLSAIKSERYQQEIQADVDEASYLGVTTTPSFLINGIPVVGAQPTADFVRLIEKAAKQS